MSGTGDVATVASTSVNQADETNGAAGILGTARNSSGSARAVADLRPEDMLTADGGIQITVANALRIGLLTQDKDGTYREAQAAPKAAEVALEEGQGPQGLEPAVEAEWSEIVKGVNGNTHIAAMVQAIDRGEINRTTLEAIAGELNISPDEADAKAHRIADGMQAQTDAMLTKLGATDVADVYEWLRTNKPSDLRAAMHEQAMKRSTSQYAPLYQSYVEAMADHSPDSIMSATEVNGGSIYRRDDGKVIVKINGRGEMEWRNAVRLNLVKVSRARAK